MMLTILYNGACPICSREIAHYRSLAQKAGASVVFEDLETTDLSLWGLDADAARRRLHARQGGQILAGLEAFRAVWALLPGWRWLAWLTGLPLIRPVTSACYERLAAPLLYRRACRAGVCAPR